MNSDYGPTRPDLLRIVFSAILLVVLPTYFLWKSLMRNFLLYKIGKKFQFRLHDLIAFAFLLGSVLLCFPAIKDPELSITDTALFFSILFVYPIGCGAIWGWTAASHGFHKKGFLSGVNSGVSLFVGGWGVFLLTTGIMWLTTKIVSI